jgi:GNAT superfamily N-acetyltransferase
MRHIVLKSIVLLSVPWFAHADIRFEKVIEGSDTSIAMSEGEAELGFVYFRKIPWVPWYAIHSLYVHPQFRKKGYGTMLVKHACAALKELGATRAYIQPGPFELQDEKLVSVGAEYAPLMKVLVAFYKKLGFQKVSTPMSALARFFYFITNIREDANFLMVKEL